MSSRELTILPAHRDVIASYRGNLLELFAEKDFYFKSFWPCFLRETDVLGLLTEDQTQLLLRDDELIGLWDASYTDYGGMLYALHFRVSKRVSNDETRAILDELTASFTRSRPVKNIVHSTLSLDRRGIAAFSSSNHFETAGVLENYAFLHGRPQGRAYFSLARSVS